jgi:hypothetical protein
VTRLVLRKAILMAGILSVFFGLVWMLQSRGDFTDGMISSDPRLWNSGIALVIAGIVAIIVARKI